jgi:hypothetical protein
MEAIEDLLQAINLKGKQGKTPAKARMKAQAAWFSCSVARPE